jgi:hypothetical protein
MDNTQQPKPDPKWKAIASFVLAVIALLLLSPIYRRSPLMNPWDLLLYFPRIIARWGILLYFFFILIIAVWGLILGRKGLSSTKRNWAILGILLCIISLLLCLPNIFLAVALPNVTLG